MLACSQFGNKHRPWSEAHERYLATVSFEFSAQNIAFTEYRQAIAESQERVQRLSEALRNECENWRMKPLVAALATLRGVDFLAAVTLVAEIGHFRRFAHPSELMGYLGLVPSEYSSGDSFRRGDITKTGNSHARRMLIEAAWNYRFPPRLSRLMHIRQEGQPKAIRETACRAQLRLGHRYRRLHARKMHVNKICVAIARELAGFVWAIACQVPAAD
jgi:transposase